MSVFVSVAARSWSHALGRSFEDHQLGLLELLAELPDLPDLPDLLHEGLALPRTAA